MIKNCFEKVWTTDFQEENKGNPIMVAEFTEWENYQQILSVPIQVSFDEYCSIDSEVASIEAVDIDLPLVNVDQEWEEKEEGEAHDEEVYITPPSRAEVLAALCTI